MSSWWLEDAKDRLKDMGYTVIKTDNIKRLTNQASVDKMQFHYVREGDALMQSIYRNLGVGIGVELMKHATIKVEDEAGGPYSCMGPRRIFRASVDVLT